MMCWVSTARKENKFQFQQVDAVLYGQLYSSSTNILHCRNFSLLVKQCISRKGKKALLTSAIAH
jgi:hypothetical protein